MVEKPDSDNVWISPDELSEDERELFAEINKKGRLVNALKQARHDFDSGNFKTYASVDEYLAEIKKQAIAKTQAGHSVASHYTT